MTRVHRDDSRWGRLEDGVYHGHHARGFLLGSNGRMAGARRLATHVNDVSAVVKHLHGTRNSCLDVEVLPAVREGVGRYVEDAHDAWTRKRDFVFTALPGCVVLSKHGSDLPGARAPARLSGFVHPYIVARTTHPYRNATCSASAAHVRPRRTYAASSRTSGSSAESGTASTSGTASSCTTSSAVGWAS